MSDLVRETGSVEDIHGRRLAVGTDHDAVTLWNFMLSPAQQEEFAQLFVAAVWQAKANAEAMRAEAAEVSG